MRKVKHKRTPLEVSSNEVNEGGHKRKALYIKAVIIEYVRLWQAVSL